MTTKTSGLIGAVADLNLPTDGVSDCYPILQAAIRSLTGPAAFIFPAGTFLFSRPIIAGPFGPEFRGAGRTLTTLGTLGTSSPVLAFGIREVDAGNAQVTTAHRPDCLGPLDRSFTSSPGSRCGWRSMGNTWLLAAHHPITLGAKTTAFSDSGWDYHSEMAEWSLEVAFGFPAGFPSNASLLGLGSIDSNPMPWFLGTTTDSRFYFTFKTSDYTSAWSVGQLLFYFLPPPIDPTILVMKLRIWIAWDTGEIGAAINGIPVPIVWSTSTAPNLLGKRFCRNRGEFSFFAGVSQDNAGPGGPTVPDFIIYALRTSCVARRTEPANDGARYLPDGSTVAFLPGTSPVGRDIAIGEGNGQGADLTLGSAWIMPATKMAGGISGGGVQDMTVTGGSPSILIGPVLNGFRIENVIANGRHLGIGSLPNINPSYPVILRDVQANGTDAGISLWRTEVWADNIIVTNGGVTSLRFIGGNTFLRNAFASFFNANAENIVRFLPEQWGGTILIDGLNADTEANVMSDAAIAAELFPYSGSTNLEVKRLNISGVGNVPIVRLRGHALQPGTWNAGSFTASNWATYTASYPAALSVDQGWSGTADFRNLPVATVVGSGSSSIVTPATAVPLPAPTGK